MEKLTLGFLLLKEFVRKFGKTSNRKAYLRYAQIVQYQTTTFISKLYQVVNS
jgi:hypothetical protein